MATVMAYERLSPQDAGFLHIEDAVTPMHIGSVSIMEGPPPAYARLRDMVAGKLPLVRRYRQVVRPVPFDLGRPVWVDDPYFNLEYHLRHTALPRPGSEEELRNLVGRLMAQKLDRAKPLWEIWMVEGLEEDRWALVSKVHHCMVDGVSGTDLLGLILDTSPDTEPEEPGEWLVGPTPAGWELAFEAVAGLLTSPFEAARVFRVQTGWPETPRRAANQLGEFLSGLRITASNFMSPSTGTLNGPIGPHRRWVATSLSVADIKTVRHALGGTFNDVVLAVITRGFRDLLLSRGESTEHPIRTMVPVYVRPRDERGRATGDGKLANKVSAMFADLPVGLADPVERLTAISAQMAGLKESKQALAAENLTHMAGFAPPILLSLAGRLGTKLAQNAVNTVTTNVPGPQIPLYAAGRRMLQIFPYVPLGIQLRIGVAIFSYDGSVTFGITGDYDSAPDIKVLADGIGAGMTELLSSHRPESVIDLRSHRPQGAFSGTS
jgi:diacylglycerol O-acyltransferase / wax synthase